MARFLVQSLDTGRFLVPGEFGPEWCVSLEEARAGFVDDYEEAAAMAVEWAEVGERCSIVSIDHLCRESSR